MNPARITQDKDKEEMLFLICPFLFCKQVIIIILIAYLYSSLVEEVYENAYAAFCANCLFKDKNR